MDFHREIVRCSLFSKDCVNLGEGHYFCKIWMNTIFLSRNANFRMHRKIPKWWIRLCSQIFLINIWFQFSHWLRTWQYKRMHNADVSVGVFLCMVLFVGCYIVNGNVFTHTWINSILWSTLRGCRSSCLLTSPLTCRASQPREEDRGSSIDEWVKEISMVSEEWSDGLIAELYPEVWRGLVVRDAVTSLARVVLSLPRQSSLSLKCRPFIERQSNNGSE